MQVISRLVPLAPLLLAACSTVPAAPTAQACPIVDPGEWAAWVNAMPGINGGPRLIVTGKPTVPTGGYRFDWGTPVVAESSPVQVTVELRPVPPSGMATQALVTEQVRGQWPSQKYVGSVRIVCGGRQLATISPVEIAQ